ncbi:clathrin light chain, partial [Mortierella sp. GBAus27b]
SDDPTADFLAREQAALGGDADFLASLASAGSPSNNIGSDFESTFPSFAEHEASITSPPASSGKPISTPTVTVAADDDFGTFHSEYPPIETTDSAPVSQVSPYLMLEWREKQAGVIAEKDEKSETKRQQTIVAAHEAIDRFYEDYNQKKERSIADNRNKESEFLTKRDDVSSGTQWERINRHLDSSPAAVAAALRAGRRDTSRMRELLRDLEKDPNAPG